MDEFDIRILAVLIFLIFGSTLTMLVRKFKNRIFRPKLPVYSMTIRAGGLETTPVSDVVIPLPEGLVNGAVNAFDRIQTIPDIRSDLLEELEERFFAQQENKAFAKAAVHAFRAWQTGIMLQILDPDNQLSKKARKPFQPAITAPEFKQFVFFTFLGVQNPDLMPAAVQSLQAQYTAFFRTYRFRKNEFLLGWAQHLMLTNQALILFSRNNTPEIEQTIPLQKVKTISYTPVGLKRL